MSGQAPASGTLEAPGAPVNSSSTGRGSTSGRVRVAAGGSNVHVDAASAAAGGSGNSAATSAPGERPLNAPIGPDVALRGAGALSPLHSSENEQHADPSAIPPSVTRVGRFEYRPHNCFACGQLNSGGLHLQLHVDGERCWTEFVIPRRFEGWEGITHGGILSAIVDEVMAWSLITVDHVGVTARLEVDFRRPVAIDQPIRAEGWIVERRRRRFDTAATVLDRDTGVVLVQARAIYLAADPTRSKEIRERYGFRIADETETTAP